MSIPRIAITLGLALCASLVLFRVLQGGPVQPQQLSKTDARLQATAESALGQREGTVVVIDPQTGRVGAVVNPDVASGQVSPPGSTIKPFIALAALRAGIIAPDTRLRCRHAFQNGGRAVGRGYNVAGN